MRPCGAGRPAGDERVWERWGRGCGCAELVASTDPRQSARGRLQARDQTPPPLHIDQYYRSATSPHPRIRTPSFRDREVGDASIECALFITGWSSVVFDAAYVGRAIIHVPFDEAEYLSGHYGEGWLDVDTLGFGPVARTVGELVGHIEAYLATGCVREPEDTARTRHVFAHADRGNSERVVQEIDRL